MSDFNKLYRYPEEQYRMDSITNGVSKEKTCIIYSALDKLVLTQETPLPDEAVFVDSNCHLTVYADSVIIRGKISFPGKNVCISSRLFGSEFGPDNTPPQIDVSGAKPPLAQHAQPQLSPAAKGEPGYIYTLGGRSPGGTGQAGNQGSPGEKAILGKNGGQIEIYTDRFLPKTSLELFANGGNGGAGQKGQDGQDGGMGGDGDKTFMSYYVIGGSGGPGGQGGTGGAGGMGGEGGSIRIVACDASNVEQLTAHVLGGNGGDGGEGGTGGQGGDANSTVHSDLQDPFPCGGAGGIGGIGGNSGSGGAGGKIEYSSLLKISSFFTGGNPGNLGTNGGGGNGGAAGHPQDDRSKPGSSGSTPSATGICGNAGIQGSNTELLNIDLLLELARVSAALQRTMLLQKVNLLYLAADAATEQKPYAQVAMLLQWLLDTTKPFNTLTPPGNFSTNDVAMLKGIYWHARTLATRLKLRLDYFGHQPTYAPLGTFEFYDGALSSMLGDNGTFKAIETTYFNFFDAMEEGRIQRQALTDALVQAEDEKKNLSTQLETTTSSVESICKAITADNNAVDSQHTRVITATTWAKEELEQLDLMTKTLNFLAVLPGLDNSLAEKISGEINKQVQWGISVAEDIPSLPSSDIVKQVDQLGINVKTLDEGYTVGQGLISESDPNAYKLLVTEADFEKAVQPYIELSKVKSAIDEIREYTRLVQQRNADILQFNTDAAQLASLKAQISHNAAQLEQVNAALSTTSNPALASLTTFMARLYQDARTELIKTFYMAAKSFAFWSLKSDYSDFSTLVGLSNPSGIDTAALSKMKQKIIVDLEHAIEAFGTNAQEFPASPEKPSVKGVLLTLTERENPSMFAVFKTPNGEGIHKLSFRLPIVRRETSESDNPFYSKANVRLSRVRPWVNGATVDPNALGASVLTVIITHGGNDIIVSPANDVYTFAHEKISKNFQFDCKSMQIVQDTSFTNGPNEKSLYASPGPFTTWQIKIDPKYNTGLDMSKVDSVTIEFWGTSYAFSQIQKDKRETLDRLP